MTKIKKRGGRREGAGRKPIGEARMKYANLTIPVETRARLGKVRQAMNISYRELIELLLDNINK